ncbi:associated molecule with the SH3 domain of STAM 3 [Actinidia rufa]|uniref:Associated molecule with the SH3 domain of STAM 3 n=1 Tax=Actinidia rufa TaxID=165716 RepID=A0A7J0GSV0_9ERIC|nr:associated molecule with the SH3 domain of STAM 3 [Actinidia rufa]
MRPPQAINLNALTRKVDVDNRFPLRNYYRIADNLLKQASIYREENNVIDLYIILLRYSSLVSETIPFHRDYQGLLPKERIIYRKKLPAVLDELESLKPKFRHLQNEANKTRAGTREYQLDAQERNSYGSEASHSECPLVNRKASLSLNNKQEARKAPLSPWQQNNNSTQVFPASSIDAEFQKLSINLTLPKKETLSRHSFLGPNGLRGQWLGPSPEIKVNYPSHTDLTPNEDLGLNQAAQYDLVALKDVESGVDRSTMDSLLSLDDGRWLGPSDDSCTPLNDEASNGPLVLGNIRQPSPPPVLAHVQPEFMPISPSRVADPRPGPAKPFHDGMPSSNTYQHLHIVGHPVKMMQDFLRLTQQNTAKNLETCGILAGSLRNKVFCITTLIIPKQESTSDSIMLPEAIAIVMAPTDTSSPHGIFHLSDPGGVSIIRNCQQRGFHPHEEPDDGSPIYEHCSHVFMNPNLKFDVIVSLLLGGLLHQFVDSTQFLSFLYADPIYLSLAAAYILEQIFVYILEQISAYNLDSSSSDLFGDRSPRFSIHFC